MLQLKLRLFLYKITFKCKLIKNMGTFVSVLEVKNEILLLNIKKNN